MIIDSHQHFWIYHPDHQPWITEDMALIQKDFLPTDLKPVLTANSVNGCIAVQAEQSPEETDFLLHLANQHSFIKGVVGWVDLCSETIEDTLREYAKNPLFKGVRHILQAEEESFFSNDSFKRGMGSLAGHHLTYDLLVYHDQLAETIKLVSQFPDQKFVLDHLGKPNIKLKEIEAWSEHITTLSRFDNVYVKVSGMVTEANWTQWKPKDMEPYLEVIFDVFSADRIMFGSDWPVCLVAADYGSVKNIVESYISQLTIEEQKKIMGLTACDFYGLGSEN